MKGRLIIADARKVSPADFLADVLGKPRKTEAEKAEAQTRHARFRLYETIERAEYARARREREAVIREGQREDETYAEFYERLNAPHAEAAKRIRERMAAHRRRVAA